MASPSGLAPSVLETLSNDLAAAVERASRSIVAIQARRRIPASGVVWRPGLVVASNHTIQRDEDITIGLPDGSSVSASLSGRDPTTDLAVLTYTGNGAAVAERAPAEELRVGALVLALGRPGPSVTAGLGVISSVGGEWRTWQGGRIDRFVRLDLSIYDGFSGGPLVSATGRVLGINTSALARAAAITVPASTVDRVVDQLARDGRVMRGFVGLGMQPVRFPDGVAKQLDLPGDVGLMVVALDSEGPADAAGIMLGDIMVSFGGTPVTDPSELLALLGPDSVGTKVEARVVRAGAVTTKTITIGERPRERQRRRP